MTRDPLTNRSDPAKLCSEEISAQDVAEVVGDTRVADLVRRAFLATKRDELLTPVRVIGEVSSHILGVARDMEQPGFSADVEKIQSAGQSLLVLVNQILTPTTEDAPSVEDETVRSRLRHDMLNELNPIINYSEMWLEEADELFLTGFVPELEMINNSGRRCAQLVDHILASWDMDSSTVADGAPDLQHIRDIFVRQEASGETSETDAVLVVDDNDINRDILRRHLDLQETLVSTASDGMARRRGCWPNKNSI